jgi:hypothetical protein
MSHVHTRRRGDRVLGLAFCARLLALLAGAVWLVIVQVTHGAAKAGPLGSALSTDLTIAGALVTLVTW